MKGLNGPESERESSAEPPSPSPLVPGPLGPLRADGRKQELFTFQVLGRSVTAVHAAITLQRPRSALRPARVYKPSVDGVQLQLCSQRAALGPPTAPQRGPDGGSKQISCGLLPQSVSSWPP
ncbi:hypothetical protein EYF80_067293 [Liparis tanakae]|uniref:Uncharacterized protein n=1 Tax=Liparis tanakae TaxID=230148 RepID=A0A4Z2E1F9_9TELE|nr:hypothetical protein EYF80_067293 [Liparis tanakae]